MAKFKDLTGQKFNRLRVLKIIGKNEKGHYVWECKCDCNIIINVLGVNLTNNRTKSCGCLWKDKFIKHNMWKTRFYKIWLGMKSRCFNKNNARYKCYKGRGITVCDRWLDFNNFKEDMYESYTKHVEEYGEKETTIDRIDNDKNYEKDNCRWATWSEQSKNKRPGGIRKSFKAISPDGIEYISDNKTKFAREHELNKNNINYNLRQGCINKLGWKFEYV